MLLSFVMCVMLTQKVIATERSIGEVKCGRVPEKKNQ